MSSFLLLWLCAFLAEASFVGVPQGTHLETLHKKEIQNPSVRFRFYYFACSAIAHAMAKFQSKL